MTWSWTAAPELFEALQTRGATVYKKRMSKDNLIFFFLSLSLKLAGQFSQAVFHTEIAVIWLSKPSFYMLGLFFRKAACQMQTGEIHLVSSLRAMRGLKGQIGTNTTNEDTQVILVFGPWEVEKRRFSGGNWNLWFMPIKHHFRFLEVHC